MGNIRTCCDEICFDTLNYKIIVTSIAETSVDGSGAYV